MVYATFYFLFLFIYCRFIFFMFFFFFFIFFVFFLFFFYFYFFFIVFFFQAEDGIRDRTVMEFRRVLFRSRDRPQAERRARRCARERGGPQALRRHGPRRQALIARGVRQLRAVGAGALESGAGRKEVLSYMLRRYWPPTSNRAWVICPSEQTRTASISTAKTFSLRITAWRSRSSMAGERSEFF